MAFLNPIKVEMKLVFNQHQIHSPLEAKKTDLLRLILLLQRKKRRGGLRGIRRRAGS